MTKPKRPITRLWLCELVPKPNSQGYDIHVRKGPVRGSYGGSPRYSRFRYIRACTAKAAGRRLRKNIPTQLAALDAEFDNPGSNRFHNMEPGYVNRYKKYAKLADIKVIK